MEAEEPERSDTLSEIGVDSSANNNARLPGAFWVLVAAVAAIICLMAVGVTWVIFYSLEQRASVTSVSIVTTDKQYDSAPPMQIDTSRHYTAAVKMAGGGEFVIELYADKAPITVNNFVFLARDHYFDGVTFHRVLDGFMAQTGDPTDTGAGGPGYVFKDEVSDLTFDKAGVVAMANAGPDTNGSQFFITFGPTPHLDGGYTIFGQVTSGMDVVNGITRRDPEGNPTFEGDAIETVTITEEP